MTPSQAIRLCEQVKLPLLFATRAQKYLPTSTNGKNRKIKKPNEFLLVQNYHNTFNSSTTIAFKLAKRSFVSLKIYDSLGRLVRELVEENYLPGQHQVKWNGKNANGFFVPSGLYFYKLTTDDFSTMKKLIVIR